MNDLKQYGICSDGKENHEELVYTVALIYNLLNSNITNYLAGYNLTPGKLNVLVAIRHHGGKEGLTQIQISRHLIVTKSNMTKHLDKLEKEGMITRSSKTGDRRVKIIRITKKAGKLLDSIWDEYNQRLKSLINDLNKDKQKQLARLLLDWFGILVEKVK